jgi:thiamine kinase-like enzyme
VTFWGSVSEKTVYAPIGDVAELIKRLHELVAPDYLHLQELAPFGALSDPLPTFAGLSRDDAGFLQERILWARGRFPDLPFELPRGVIHGDANVGNVLVDESGKPVLIDLDSFAIGPREWDLIQTALFYDRLGWHTPEEYRAFVDVYGWDITQWEGYSELADMREIAMTSWLSKKAADSPSTAAEASKRIAAIRNGGSRRDWGAY